MYAKCGMLTKARELLSLHGSSDPITWTALISGHVRKGQSLDALNIFNQMQQMGVSPDAVTYSSILKACASLKALKKGTEIHDEVIKEGLLRTNLIVANALVDMYVKCGALNTAEAVLEELPSRDVVSWSTLITGYVEHGHGERALECFGCMQCEGILANEVTFISVLRACGILGAIDKGKEIHSEISRQGMLKGNEKLGTALVDMYVKCGALVKATHVLNALPTRSVATWNVIITGYIEAGQCDQAVFYFDLMQKKGFCPNAITYTCILKVCGVMRDVEKGKMIHNKIQEQGWLDYHVPLRSALVDMYAKCGDLVNARSVFEALPARDIVSWGALIAGYVQEGEGQDALDCFNEMESEGHVANAVTFSCALKACGITGALEKGEQIHREISKQKILGNDVVLGNSLVDMYAKCGALVKAQEVFNELSLRNTVTWNALIAGYTKHGLGKQALSCFDQMLHDGVSPDVVTLSCVLNACNHLGLVEECFVYFRIIVREYRVTPVVEHYSCMVDLFGRTGCLEKAACLIQDMPSSDCPVLWRTLLGACQKWSDINVGKWAFQQALQSDECDGAAHILMASIYAGAGLQENAREIESRIS
ncbi:hypothetical protein KP509_18G023200 [Ceratopteris richardii]|nr:hypothetical protein KP509_18G023200 [Ceratopteris richardii]